MVFDLNLTLTDMKKRIGWSSQGVKEEFNCGLSIPELERVIKDVMIHYKLVVFDKYEFIIPSLSLSFNSFVELMYNTLVHGCGIADEWVVSDGFLTIECYQPVNPEYSIIRVINPQGIKWAYESITQTSNHGLEEVRLDQYLTVSYEQGGRDFSALVDLKGIIEEFL